jgi:hypothetical protein
MLVLVLVLGAAGLLVTSWDVETLEPTTTVRGEMPLDPMDRAAPGEHGAVEPPSAEHGRHPPEASPPPAEHGRHPPEASPPPAEHEQHPPLTAPPSAEHEQHPPPTAPPSAEHEQHPPPTAPKTDARPLAPTPLAQIEGRLHHSVLQLVSAAGLDDAAPLPGPSLREAALASTGRDGPEVTALLETYRVTLEQLATHEALPGSLGVFEGVGSSTGAWVTAYAQRVLAMGDFAAVANLSQNYSTVSNPLFPLLMVLGARVSGLPPATLGHLLAGACLLLVVPLLALLWSRGRSLEAGLLAALAVLWPPLLASATWVRPDTTALLLFVACLVLAQDLSRGRAWPRWIAAGIGLGLVYLTREYMLAPAGAAVGTAWLMDLLARPRGERLRPALARALATTGGSLACALLPLCLGFYPWNGLSSIWSYGGTDHPARFTLSQLHYLPTMAPLWLLGLAGLGIGAWRGRGLARAAALVSLAALAPFAAFMVSNQQSPHYYVTAHLLLLTGLAGWLDLLRWRGARWGLLLGLAGGALWWCPPRAAALLGTDGAELEPRLHTEAWPAPREEIDVVVDWSLTWAWDAPLVVVTQHIENLDSLYTVRHQRPVAILYGPDWAKELPDWIRHHRGREVFVLTVVPAQGRLERLAGSAPLGLLETAHLRASMASYDGETLLPRTRRRDYPCIDWRGTCQQLDWLEGGQDGLRARTMNPGPEFAGGYAPGILRASLD